MPEHKYPKTMWLWSNLFEANQLKTVTFVSPRYLPYIGGVETHVSEVARRTQWRFGDCSVITTDPSGRLPHFEVEDNGLAINRVRSYAPHENYHIPSPALIRQLKQDRPAVLHVHSIHDLPGPLAGLIENKAAVILTPHYSGTLNTRLGRSLFSIYRPMLRRLFRKSTYIICVSQFEAEALVSKFPRAKGKVQVIPNGVDPLLQSKYQWKEPDPPRVLYAGRLERAKNVDKVLLACYQLRKERPDLKMTIHGKGPLKPELMQTATKLGMYDDIEWSPKKGVSRDKLYECYTSSTVLVYPSDFECYGIVPAEAMSVGTPTVVTNSTALANFVQGGIAQPVEPPVTTQKLVKVIGTVLDNPRQFSKGAKGMIMSWDKVAEKTWDLYEPAMKR